MKIKVLLIAILSVFLLCIFTSCNRKSDSEMNAKVPIMNEDTEAPEKSGVSPSQEETQKPSDANTQQLIKAEQAKKIALDDAKLSEGDVTFHEVELEEDDGISYFDIKFVSNGQEYEYEINAVTSEIIEWDKETEDD